jgi:hypothetical protein
MNPSDDIGTKTDRPQAYVRGRLPSRPSVTKEDIEKTKHEVVEAERMLEDVTNRRVTKASDHERLALRRIQESGEFQARVDIYRKELVRLFDPVKNVC